MNYVEVSIPYPKSMTITRSQQNYVTTPMMMKIIPVVVAKVVVALHMVVLMELAVQLDQNMVMIKLESKRQTGYDGTAVLKKQKLMLTDMMLQSIP